MDHFESTNGLGGEVRESRGLIVADLSGAFAFVAIVFLELQKHGVKALELDHGRFWGHGRVKEALADHVEGSFAFGPRWLDRYSPLWGWPSFAKATAGRPGLAALAKAKIPRRRTPPNFQTGSKGIRREGAKKKPGRWKGRTRGPKGEDSGEEKKWQKHGGRKIWGKRLPKQTPRRNRRHQKVDSAIWPRNTRTTAKKSAGGRFAFMEQLGEERVKWEGGFESLAVQGIFVTLAQIASNPDRNMISTRYGIVALIFMLVLGVGVMLTVLQARKYSRFVLKSKEGHLVKLEGYAFDQKKVRYELPSSSWTQRFLTKLPLPRSVRDKFKFPKKRAFIVAVPDFPGEPTLSAAFSIQTPPGVRDIGALRIKITDDHGQEFDPAVQSAEGGEMLYWANEIRVFPRRGKDLHLHLLDGTRALGDFVIHNPAARARYPQWEAKPLPLSVTNQELEVRLIEFRTFRNLSPIFSKSGHILGLNAFSRRGNWDLFLQL